MGRKKMGDTRRRQILEGLLKAVGEHGLQHCNMTDVAEAAGVSRGILHYYFKNKDEMIGALVTYVKESYLPDFHDQTKQIDDPKEQLNKSLWYPVQTFGQGGATLAKVWIEFWGLAAHNPDVHQFILDAQAALRTHFLGILRAGIAGGIFSNKIKPEKLASVILAALEGLVLQWHFNPENFSFVGEMKALELLLENALKP